MSDEIKEIYLSNLEWTKTHDNIGGVMGNLIFKDNMTYEEYQRLFKNTYFVLCNKDYITDLQQKYDKALSDLVKESHKRMELSKNYDRLNNIINELEKWIDEYPSEDVWYEHITNKLKELADLVEKVE